MIEDKLRKYKQLNNSFKTNKFIYHLGVEAGFFSEFNNMILAMLYCLTNRIQFFVYSKDANFRYNDGWSDYFESFSEEYGNILHSLFNRRTNPRFKNKILRNIDSFLSLCFRKIHPSILTTADLWNEIRNQKLKSQYKISELGIDGDLRTACRDLIEIIWKYNSETQFKIDNLKENLHLTDSYIGLHIRGGDKFSEADILSPSKYIKKAEELTSIRNAFVLTDDYSVIEKLEEEFKEWNFYTLCGKEEKGYFHNQFLHENKEIKRERYIKLFAAVDIISNAQYFIGTFSSNPGMYLGMRMCPEKTYSLDIPEWQIW